MDGRKRGTCQVAKPHSLLQVNANTRKPDKIFLDKILVRRTDENSARRCKVTFCICQNFISVTSYFHALTCTNLLTMQCMMSWCRITASPAPLYLSESFFPLPPILLIKLIKDLVVGMMLKGGGKVEPASK